MSSCRYRCAEREAELLPVGYFHVVFTLPAPVADIAYHNKAVIYDLLFKAAADTTLTITVDPKHLGARIGITAVLHFAIRRRMRLSAIRCSRKRIVHEWAMASKKPWMSASSTQFTCFR